MNQQLDTPIKLNNSIKDSKPDLQPQNDEIDIIALLVSVYAVLRKNFILLLISGLVFIFAGIAAVLFLYPSFYKSSFIAYSKNVPIKQIDLIINELERVAMNDDPSVLTKQLGLTEKQAAEISAIEVLSQEGEDNARFFTIEIYTKDIEQIQDLDHKIIAFLNSRPFIESRNRLEIKKLQGNIQDLEQELVKLESMQNELSGMLSNINSGKSMLNTNVHLQDMSAISQRIIGMKSEMNSYEYELQSMKSIEIMQGILSVSKGRKVSTSKLLTLVVVISGLLAFGLVVIKEFVAYANKQIA